MDFLLYIVFLFFTICQIYRGKVYAIKSRDPSLNYSSEVFHDLVTNTPIADDKDINSKQRVSEILRNLLEGGRYDPEVRPSGVNGSGPVIIYVGAYIRSIDNIDDLKMEYSMQMSFRQEWIDPRIKYSHNSSNMQYLNLAVANKIWSPDLFFTNEKKGTLHQLMTPNVYTRIFPDGRILQSYRITLTMSCIFDLRRYPMDKQACPIFIVPYGWASEDLVVMWSKPISVESLTKLNYNTARFVLKNYSITENCMTTHYTGSFSCVGLYLHFSRQLGVYFIQIYIPCALLVIVSWVSFWLETTAVDARISLGVTTILTIVTLTYGINQSVQPASYIKAVDVWTCFCQAMVFGATLQFSTVNYIFQNKRIKSKNIFVVAQINCLEEILMEAGSKLTKEPSFRKAKKIDLISRIIFPVIFILFNIVYWTAYIF